MKEKCVHEYKHDSEFDPVDTRRLHERLYQKPAGTILTRQEKELDKKLRLHTIRHVKPYLREFGAVKALEDYVHDADIYKQFTRYSFAPKKFPKPPGFDRCQKALAIPSIRRGAQQAMTTYRCINRRDMDGSFHRPEEWYTTQFDDDTADSLFYVNRNVSTSISPIAAIRFLSAKDPGTKCCMLVFKIPKGYPYLYMPGLFPNSSLVEKEREVLVPSGEYYASETGWSVRLNMKTLNLRASDMEHAHEWKGKTSVTMKVMVLEPLHRYSEFVTGPKSLFKIPYMRQKHQAEQMKISNKSDVGVDAKPKKTKQASSKKAKTKGAVTKKGEVCKATGSDKAKVDDLLKELQAIFGFKVKCVKA